jgi:hypothetical protein
MYLLSLISNLTRFFSYYEHKKKRQRNLMKKNILFFFEIFQKTDFCNISQIFANMINRPPIKNNLNEQLKIYYTYRDETTKDRLNNIENRPVSQ